jgi:hypothetical protein
LRGTKLRSEKVKKFEVGRYGWFASGQAGQLKNKK